MPTSAAGNKSPLSRQSARGFTLIELMVVVALIAVATAGAMLSLRDSTSALLERDAQRLVAILESARAQARAGDATVVWHAQDGGFVLRGLPPPEKPQTWLSSDTRSRVTMPVLLGPEPLIPPQRIELYSASQPQQRLWVVSDGLQPFTLQAATDRGTP